MDNLIEILRWTWPLVALVGAAVVWFVTRPRISCPECGCTKIGKLKTQDDVVFHRPWMSLDNSPLFTEVYSIQYTCNQCRHLWKIRTKETK